MAHNPADLQKAMQAAAPANVVWRYKPMFGGIGVYADDRMCVSLSDVGLAIKLTGAEHQALLKLKGAKPLQYEPSAPPSKTYVVVPAAMLANRKALGGWLAAGAAQAAAAPAKKPGKTTQKPGKAGVSGRRT
jgi:TfoX/Sxy family transcriptional regulator of competence genes